jgi:hypothetical protein
MNGPAVAGKGTRLPLVDPGGGLSGGSGFVLPSATGCPRAAAGTSLPRAILRSRGPQ